MSSGITYAVREQQAAGPGRVIGHIAASDIPPDDRTLIRVNGALMHIVAVREEDNTIVVEPFADPG